MKQIKFEIKKHLGVLSGWENGRRKEINLVSWFNGEPKIDIREWNRSHDTIGKGVTLSLEELIRVKEILSCTPISEFEYRLDNPTKKVKKYSPIPRSSSYSQILIRILFDF
jgi:hypothetical protein